MRASDRIDLAAGVVLTPEGLHDHLRGAGGVVTLNGSARVTVGLFDGRTLDDVGAALVARYGIEAARARADAAALAVELNQKMLVNVDPRAGELVRMARWAGQAVRGLPLLVVPRLSALPSVRWALPRDRPFETARVVAAALTPRATLLGLALVLPVVLMLGTLGALRLDMPAALLMGFVLGLVVHEAGHALALGAHPAALGVDGASMFVMHRPLTGRRRALVAASGPLAAAAAGWLLLMLAVATHWPPLALTASLLTFQALGLTILGHDGRKTCGLS